MTKNQSITTGLENISLFDGKVVECRLKAAHQLVWQGLEAANSMWNRMVFVSEIIETFTEEEKKFLQSIYSKNIEAAAAVILDLLETRGLVTVKKGSRFRFYGSPRLLNPEECSIPIDPVSRRQSVLILARKVASFYKRAVRAKDFIEFSQKHPNSENVDQTMLVRDLKNLSDTGELRIVGTIRGDGGGLNLYLPSELNPEEYLPDNNLTWLESVASAFQMMWRDRVVKAAEEKSLPQPVSTAEIRNYLESVPDPNPRLNEQKAVTNALKALSETNNPIIRRIKIRATGNVIWVPVDVSDEETALNGGHNSNKIIAAVERAEDRLNHPVSVNDVKEEIKLDPLLIPIGKQTVAQLLSQLSKSKIADGKNARRDRVMVVIQRVGSVGGKSYYTTDKYDKEDALLYIDYLTHLERWEKTIVSESLELIANAQLQSIKHGRIILFQKEVNSLRLAFLKLLLNQKIKWEMRQCLEKLLAQAEAQIANINKWLKSNSDESIPVNVIMSLSTLTAAELIEVYRPLYPVIADLKDTNKMVTLSSKYLRRIPNKAFRSRFSPNGEEAMEYLYDRTDALIFAAIKWGGTECRYQALIASHELNLLRDVNFVLPELSSDDYQKRIRAVACLAFLQTEEGTKRLYEILQTDPIADVRLSALWAFAFAGGKPAVELTVSVAQSDNDERVKKLASMINQSEQNDLWFL